MGSDIQAIVEGEKSVSVFAENQGHYYVRPIKDTNSLLMVLSMKYLQELHIME